MKRGTKIGIWFAILIYLGVVLSFISSKKKDIVCEKVEIEISDKTGNNFIEEKDVLNILNDRGEELTGRSIESVNVNKLEELFLHNPLVKNSNVYSTYNGKIKVTVEQRNPILRVINTKNESFYIDEEGVVMPLSNKYTAHVLVASGNIGASFNKLSNFGELSDNSLKTDDKSLAQMKDLYKLAKHIYNNKFWQAQIEQIYINGEEYELVPRIGTHIVLLGKADGFKTKLQHLKALYEQGLPKVGWNNYNKINLKYTNQIICTKRE